MELQFDTTQKFKNDLSKLSKDDRQRIVESINLHASTFDPEQGVETAHINQPLKYKLPEGLDSTLYALRATNVLRVILSIDNDPIFDTKLVTLFRIVSRGKLDQEYSSVAESLYQDFANMDVRRWLK